MLKPALARGGLRCIGATTVAEYRKYVEKDPRSSEVQPVSVDEPSVEETVEIYKTQKDCEEHHSYLLFRGCCSGRC